MACPTTSSSPTTSPPPSPRLYAADGRLLAEYAKEKRVFVPVAAMPKRLIQAFVAAEDQRFFCIPASTSSA